MDRIIMYRIIAFTHFLKFFPLLKVI